MWKFIYVIYGNIRGLDLSCLWNEFAAELPLYQRIHPETFNSVDICQNSLKERPPCRKSSTYTGQPCRHIAMNRKDSNPRSQFSTGRSQCAGHYYRLPNCSIKIQHCSKFVFWFSFTRFPPFSLFTSFSDRPRSV